MGNRRQSKNQRRQERRASKRIRGREGDKQIKLAVAANLATRKVMVRLSMDNKRALHLSRQQAIEFGMAIFQSVKALGVAPAGCTVCGGPGVIEKQEYDGGPWEVELCECQKSAEPKAEGPSKDEPSTPQSHRHEDVESAVGEVSGQDEERPLMLVNFRTGATLQDKLNEIDRLRAALCPPPPDSAVAMAAPQGQLGQG